MLKKTITYTDFNDVERTEDFYFNLSEVEILEMEAEASTSGGLAEMFRKMVRDNDHKNLMRVFKDLILKSYGEKSSDGKHFLKFDENGNPLSVGFSQTNAYVKLFMEVSSDADTASNFINGIIPQKIG